MNTVSLTNADFERFTKNRKKAWEFMSDGEWHTIWEVAEFVGCAETSASALLRDFRKRQYGAHTVDRKYEGNGVYLYRVIPNQLTEQPSQQEMF